MSVVATQGGTPPQVTVEIPPASRYDALLPSAQQHETEDAPEAVAA